ncbi:uncharacterized protein [Pseudochaenichthys georgianus]|uniref:uncharacterized protein n=1 Tax=Pseudochaenichthys georgianus TaxID=52239 RepID=UPI0039C2AE72
MLTTTIHVTDLYESGHVGRPHHVDSQSPSVRQSQTHICAALRSQYIHLKKILRPAGHLTGQAIGKPPGPPDGQSGPGFTAHRRNVVVWDKGFGKFTYEFEFYPDSQYRQMIDPGLYPLEYDVTDRIFMQIEAKSTVNNTQLFVESCSAAPYDTPNYWPTYSIIENGPAVSEQRGFINSPLTGHHHHRKREAITQSARHFISQGPLRLKRSAESTGSPATPLNLNLVFIVGCLLAAAGMISAVALYKVRASKVKYQPLASFEN